jgi:ribosomal-protein-alanine N-acetyltransferase
VSLGEKQDVGFPTKCYAFPSGRVGLRGLRPEDQSLFLEATQLSRSFHNPWIQPPLSSIEYLQLLEKCTDANFLALIVIDLPTQNCVGMVHLSQIFRGAFQNAYLSYWASQRFAGQGYMKEAIRLALHLSFGMLGLHRIEANMQPENLASIGLVRACGFVKEGFSEKYLQILGEWKDHERWAIHKEIWPELQTDLDALPRWT